MLDPLEGGSQHKAGGSSGFTTTKQYRGIYQIKGVGPSPTHLANREIWQTFVKSFRVDFNLVMRTYHVTHDKSHGCDTYRI